MNWNIRMAEVEDAFAIWSLVNELAVFEKLEHQVTGNVELVRRWIFTEKLASAFIAETEDTVVGCVIYFPTLATFRMTPGIWLEDIIVREPYRGQGIGRALINSVIGFARKEGYARVDWSVLDWNSNAIGFYESLGAQILPDWRVCRYNLT